MDSVFRSLAIYIFLLVVFRITGKRNIAQVTTFDFVLLLILGEATQQALLGNDFSVTNAFIIILTLISADTLFSILKRKWQRIDKILEGVPLIILKDGIPLEDRMKRSRIDKEDILESARKKHGFSNLDEIEYAILEKDGDISIIPKKKELK